MPIYEYVCRECGTELERLQKVSDDPLSDCPDCGEAALKRKVSAVSFRLAGGGWYETDFKSGGGRNLAGDRDEKSANGGSGSSESDSGSQPEKKEQAGKSKGTEPASGAPADG